MQNNTAQNADRDYYAIPVRADLELAFRDGYRAGIEAAARYVERELSPETAEYIRLDFGGILGEPA